MQDNWFTFFAGVGVTATLFLVVTILAMSLNAARRRQSTANLSRPEATSLVTSRDGSPPPAASTATNKGDESLAAVIMAAICAATGASTRELRIVSISPTGADGGINTPVWGWVERFPSA